MDDRMGDIAICIFTQIELWPPMEKPILREKKNTKEYKSLLNLSKRNQ